MDESTAADSTCEFTIFDPPGQEVATLIEEMKPGSYEVKLDADNVASGAYSYRLQAGDFVAAKKLLLLR